MGYNGNYETSSPWTIQTNDPSNGESLSNLISSWAPHFFSGFSDCCAKGIFYSSWNSVSIINLAAMSGLSPTITIPRFTQNGFSFKSGKSFDLMSLFKPVIWDKSTNNDIENLPSFQDFLSNFEIGYETKV